MQDRMQTVRMLSFSYLLVYFF